MKNLVIMLSLIFGAFSVCAQSMETATHYNAWYTLSTSKKLNETWSIHGLGQVRRNQLVLHWQQSYLQLALAKKITPKLSVAAGIGWVHFFPYGDFRAKYAFNEPRIWEEVAYNIKTEKWTIHQRLRWEHRFLERKYATSEGVYKFDEFMYKNRGRYRLLLKRPLKKFSLDVSNELFWDWGENSFNHISQNRFIATIGKRLNKQLNGKVGYMYQTIWKGKERDKIEHNHTLILTFSIQLN
ncbi:MAG: DUF2490 domain-containing protein [Flammeovirgaceae bacterium]